MPQRRILWVRVAGERSISERFAGLSPVKKQQLVYATVNQHIASGAIHALSMQTFTPEEWDKKRRLGF